MKLLKVGIYDSLHTNAISSHILSTKGKIYHDYLEETKIYMHNSIYIETFKDIYTSKLLCVQFSPFHFSISLLNSVVDGELFKRMSLGISVKDPHLFFLSNTP